MSIHHISRPKIENGHILINHVNILPFKLRFVKNIFSNVEKIDEGPRNDKTIFKGHKEIFSSNLYLENVIYAFVSRFNVFAIIFGRETLFGNWKCISCLLLFQILCFVRKYSYYFTTNNRCLCLEQRLNSPCRFKAFYDI